MKIPNLMRLSALLVLVLLAACSGQQPTGTPPPTLTSPAGLPFTPLASPEATQPAAGNPTPGVTPTLLIPITGETVNSPSPTDAAVEAPQCTAPASPIPALTEGPYYKAGSPERASLLEDLPQGNQMGTRLVLTGYVLDTNCQPVPGAWLDFWQADSQGQYDNSGYTLRGHQYTDENGRYKLETVVPGIYPGRTEHIHFKVQAPAGPVITSQLFLPDVAQNQSDRIFDPALIIRIDSEEDDTLHASFDFIVPSP